MDEKLKAVYVLDSAVEAQKTRYINTIKEWNGKYIRIAWTLEQYPLLKETHLSDI